MTITSEQYFSQRHRRFGAENPEVMEIPFWELMVREGKSAYWARDHFGKLNDEDEWREPVWCFDRFGMSETILEDGRTVYVAGEHEDFYDPDFCIYNDVIVRGPDDQVRIFGYPRGTFFPTDFHSATLVGNQIMLIGSLGYSGDRKPNETQVYSLSIADFQVKRIQTSGQPPGWISRHKASLGPNGKIEISGGDIQIERRGKKLLKRNSEIFTFDPARSRWEQITNRNWQEFIIRPESPVFPTSSFWLTVINDLRPTDIPHTLVPGEDSRNAVFLVEGVPISIRLNPREISVLVEGALSGAVQQSLLEEMKLKAGKLIHASCFIENLD